MNFESAESSSGRFLEKSLMLRRGKIQRSHMVARKEFTLNSGEKANKEKAIFLNQVRMEINLSLGKIWLRLPTKK